MLKTTNSKSDMTIIMKKFKNIIAMGCAAIYSAGLASGNGMHQMKEPEELQELAKEAKKDER